MNEKKRKKLKDSFTFWIYVLNIVSEVSTKKSLHFLGPPKFNYKSYQQNNQLFTKITKDYTGNE